MSRLYDLKVDENRWEVIELDNKNYHTYKLIDKLSNKEYFFNHIIGAEEIYPNEFLVYDRFSGDDFRIRRMYADNSKFHILFEKEFSRFDFITKDRILFYFYDNTGRYRSSGIYSIIANDYLEDGMWLNGLPVETFKRKKKPDEKEIYVEDEINSFMFNYPKILYTVDPNTLEPNSELYSEFKNASFPINTKEDIIKYKEEEKKYLYELEEQAIKEKKERINKFKSKILKKDN